MKLKPRRSKRAKRRRQLKRFRQLWEERALKIALLDTVLYREMMDYAFDGFGAWRPFQTAFMILEIPLKDQDIREMCKALVRLQENRHDAGF